MLDCVLRDEEEIQLSPEELVDALNDDTNEWIASMGGVLGIAKALRVYPHTGLSYSNLFEQKRRKDRYGPNQNPINDRFLTGWCASRFGVNKYKAKNKIDVMSGQLAWAWVLRGGGETRVEPKNVVVGDILLLEEDDMVCADGLLLPEDPGESDPFTPLSFSL